MSRNFTADVDTQREYFNATYFNNSGQNQIARYDTTLLKPFFNDPDKWKLAINRMRVPLSGIPLTKNNIPFETWQVGLGYTSSSANIPDDFQSYVPQINEKILTHPQYFNIVCTDNASLVTKERTKYNDISQWFGNSTYPFEAQIFSTAPQYDLKSGTNGATYFLNIITNYIAILDSTTWTLITQITTTDPIQNFCVNSSTGDLYLQTLSTANEYTFRKYTRTNNTTWTASNTWQYSDPTQFFGSIAICDGYLLGADAGSSVLVAFNLTTFTIQFQTTLNNLAQIYCYGTSNIYAVFNYVNNTLIYNIVGNSVVQVGNIPTNNGQQPLGLDFYGNIVFKFLASFPIVTFSAYNSSGALQYSFQKTMTTYPIMTFPTMQTTTEPIEAGPTDIFTYQAYLNQINAGFLKAFNKAKTDLGATFLPTQPPEIIYNAQTKLFSIVVEGQYLTKNADGSNQYIIYMNTALWNQFYFPSVSYSNGYRSILLQNYGLNSVVGNGSATLPQFIYVQQEDSTIYAFYDLVRIIVGTTRIPVSGDGEGKTFSNNGTVSNSAINMITDIVPDTTTLTPGSVIIYIPAGILRWYNLYAQQPFDKIDLILSYETKDGNIYPIEVINGEFFSVKLEFKKGPGDF
jgi:hypothetical protein